MTMKALPYLREIELKKRKITAYDDYPFNIPSINKITSLKFHPKITFFVGENGSGKSTLLEAIAVALGLNAEGGTKQSLFSTKKSHSELNKYIKTVRSFKYPKDWFFLRAESFYNLATFMDNTGYHTSYSNKSLHAQSHGESFMATLLVKLKGRGLYLMDEPEAALSPTRQLAALQAIHNLVKNDSQFIIATHSPILLAYPDAKIYSFSDTGIEPIEYEDTEHYVITKSFLNRHEQMLKHLLDDDTQEED
ncbi:AAA family ATPase [Pseudomonas sp. F1_0610]|uniref:AAA family ATPase n=1 Tax=Pseudomonas sp. F1_0610 TaxID=3114284 RepID=UPI0039C01818